MKDKDPQLKASVDELNGLFRLLFQLALPQINNLLNEGIKLNPLAPLFDLKDSYLSQLDRYLRIDFVPVPQMAGMIKFAEKLLRNVKNSYERILLKEKEDKGEKVVLPSWIKVEL